MNTARIAPLVEPTPALTDEARARAHRQIILPGFGELAQRRLAAARVLVVGAGGLGSAVVPYLAGAGIGRIGIIDDDLVELSNLHRQVSHGTADIGRPKVTSLAETVHALNPAILVDEHHLRLTVANARGIFADYDLVIDGSDNFATRYLVNDAAHLAGIPLVWGAILQYSGQVSVAWHANGPGYRDLFPDPPGADEVLNCAEGGVLPGLCGTVGSLLATEAMKLIAGVGDPLIGRVLTYDALSARTREIPYGRDPEAAAITELVDLDVACAVTRAGVSQGSAPDDASILSVDSVDLARLLSDADERAAIDLIDVRSVAEFAGRRLTGARHHDVSRIEAGDLPVPGAADRVTIIYCERDPRSIRAASALAAAGWENVTYLRGGIDAFARSAPDHIVRGSATPTKGY
ncbi:ThiF family adenylyltransferase [Leucobacter sp. cx-328]|uniref:ThiF family adenylyltransferase n=1 Tax=unclassified Leucobacter TaxID=2621730 RepID=UPI00165E9BCD|nr:MULTISPECIES: ThiF family adenylyltransferase [unclassified Leucobacter]MBC9944232.1 ThiF family adenylyltransferase [Leucobacter sp. cx-328]